jgi:hypothetical protein
VSDLDRIINVNITKQSGGIQTKNFSTILLLSKDATVVYKEYGSSTEVADDGYATTDPEYYAAVNLFSQAIAPTKFAIGQWDAAGGDTVTDALTAVNSVNDQWYGLVVIDTSTPADIVSAGTWARSNKKFMFTGTAEADALVDPDTTSTPYLLNNAGVVSNITYNAKSRDASVQGWQDLAEATYHLVRTPGSYSPVYKTLASCTPDILTTSQTNTLLGKQCNVYHEISGRDVMEQGLSTGSTVEYTDTYIGIDWLQARIQEEVFLLLSNSPKVSYTDAGVAQIESALASVLKTAVDNEFLSDYVIEAEATADQSTTDRANRTYNGLTFTATLAGAIHYVTINGTVRV